MTTSTSDRWARDNRLFLETELQRMRRLAERRALWLRHLWKRDPLREYKPDVISDVQVEGLLGTTPEAEARFNREVPEAVEVTRRVEELRAAARRQAEAMEAPPAIDRVARLFDLSGFERDLLLLCLATEVDPGFERLLAYLQDDVQRPYVTAHLAVSLLDGGAPDAFRPDAPLRKFRLVQMEGDAFPRAGRRIVLDERMLDLLEGCNRLDMRLQFLLVPLTPSLVPPSRASLVKRLAHSSGVVNLYGSAGADKRGLAASVCAEARLRAYEIPLPRIPDDPDLLRLVARDSLLLPFGILVEFDDPSRIGPLRDLLRWGRAPLCFVCTTESWAEDAAVTHARVTKLEPAEQKIVWRAALEAESTETNGRVDAIVEQFSMEPQAIAQVVSAARSAATVRSATGHLTGEDLWRACREHRGARLDGLVRKIEPRFDWDDIVLPDDVAEQLREIVSQVRNRSRVYGDWGFAERLIRGRGISALFAGPSGTGKTMAAEVLAGELDLPLYRIDLAGVVNKYIGETEKNLRRVFDAAEASGAVLFFDEADALFGRRTEVRDSHDRYANIEIDYLLQRMEEYRGLAILATNRRAALDRSFLRRLRFLVDIPFPDADRRRLIWRKVIPQDAPLGDLDWDALGRLEIPGGNIRNIAVNAAFLAAADDGPVEMRHLMQAARREYLKIDKMLPAAEFGPYFQRGTS